MIANKEFLGIVVTFLGVVIPLATFLITKREEQRQRNFEKFHKDLMKGLANQDGSIGLDQQIAIIYELRNYPKYYPVIKRILRFQINRWKTLLKSKPHFSQLMKEAKETINFVNKSFPKRFLSRLRKI